MSAVKSPSSWVVGAAGLAIGGLIALRLLIPSGMDPTVFLALGDDSPVQTNYAQRFLDEVRTRRDLGHDGRFFFVQANDPWLLQPDENAAVLDRPVYRSQRMLFPLIAGGLGAFPPGVVVWSMLITNLLAMGIGALVAAQLALRWGASPWLGLAVPLNIGLIFELDIGGAGIVAYTFALAGLLALVATRVWFASLLFAAAALSREVMVGFAVGVFVLWWLEGRRSIWRIVLMPVVGMAVWNVYLRFRLDGVPGVGERTENFTAPFVGLYEAFESWVRNPGELLLNSVLVLVVIAFVPLALRSRSPIAWGALPFAALMVVLSAEVLRESYNFSRAVVPVFTALPFLIMAPRHDPSPAGIGRLSGERP
ncbi:MAG: hypothetical protein K0R20_2288 [Actinomycetia bacterium]|jgi:hypothetical protein|nr:hypothetical protein [Actinomycetes bacterium]